MNRDIIQEDDKLQRRKKRFALDLFHSADATLADMENSPDLPQGMRYFINIMRDTFVKDQKGRFSNPSNFQDTNNIKIIGTYCLMVPEELIYAAGAIPVRLCGGSYEASSIGDELVPRDTCPVGRS